jgi:alpha-glucosidase
LVDENPAATPALPVLKLRGGAILPVGRIVQNTTETLLEPLTLIVSLDAEGRARGVLYEDAGEGYGYEEGDYLLTTYAAEQTAEEVLVRIEAEEGARSRPDRTVNVMVVTDDGTFEGSGSEAVGITVSVKTTSP